MAALDIGTAHLGGGMTIVDIRAWILTRHTHLTVIVQYQKESSIIMTLEVIRAGNGKTQPSIAGQSVVLNALNVNHWDLSLHPWANTVRVGIMHGMRLQLRKIQIIVVHLAQSLNPIRHGMIENLVVIINVKVMIV